MKLATRYFLLSCFLVLIAAGCTVGSSISGLTAKVYAVKFVPQGTSGTLKADTPNKGCKNTPHEGCILFPENTVGLIKLYLPGSKSKGKTCSDGARNVITKVEVTATGAGAKGDFTALPQPDWVKSEAFSTIDLSDGVLYSKAVTDASSQVWLLNTNGNNSALTVQSFWYRVTAQNCTTPANSWVSDPRGDNEGTRR